MAKGERKATASERTDPVTCIGVLRDAGGGSVDRDAVLHRYTVALALGWLVWALTCGYVSARGVVSKRVRGSDHGYDARYDGVDATQPRRSEKEPAD